MPSKLGDQAEDLAAQLLRDRGYKVRNLNERRPNYPTYDLEVTGADSTFRISVKARRNVWQINVGKKPAVQGLSDDSCLLAFMPEEHGAEIDLGTGRYKLLIVPGGVAREEGLHIHHVYLASPKHDGSPRSPNAGTGGDLVPAQCVAKEHESRAPRVVA